MVSATPKLPGDIERSKAQLDQGADIAVGADMQPAGRGWLRGAWLRRLLGRRQSAFNDAKAMRGLRFFHDPRKRAGSVGSKRDQHITNNHRKAGDGE